MSGCVLAALAIAGSASAALRQDPGVFVKRLVGQMVRGEYGRAWLTLHPAHRRVASRSEYVACELASPISGEVASLRVQRVVDRRVLVAGVGRVRAKAVLFRLVLRDLASGDTAVVTHTGHAVALRGAWRWILRPERYALYRADGCA